VQVPVSAHRECSTCEAHWVLERPIDADNGLSSTRFG
jgi:hypothetical protein